MRTNRSFSTTTNPSDSTNPPTTTATTPHDLSHFATPLNRIIPPHTKANKTPIHVLTLPRCSPLMMLHIEERLLRHDPQKRNFLILNQPLPHHNAVVLGISGKPEQLVNLDLVKKDRIPLIKRFTGGGTVYITSDVRFVGLMINKGDISHVQPYPTPVMKWTAELYEDCINALRKGQGKGTVETTQQEGEGKDHLDFYLYENDYCLGPNGLKFAGNAQSFIRERFLHHTSILWDLDIDNISKYLTLPSKRPEYRRSRTHKDFLTGLRPLFGKNQPQYIDYFDDFNLPQDVTHQMTQHQFDNEVVDGHGVRDQYGLIGGCLYTTEFSKSKDKMLKWQREIDIVAQKHFSGERGTEEEEQIGAEKYKTTKAALQAHIDTIQFPNLYNHLSTQLSQYKTHASLLVGMGGADRNAVEGCYFNNKMLEALNQHFDVNHTTLEDLKDVLDIGDRTLGSYIIPPVTSEEIGKGATVMM